MPDLWIISLSAKHFGENIKKYLFFSGYYGSRAESTDWSGEAVPLPTLFNGSPTEAQPKSSKSGSKPSLMELALYNMAAMLAGLAAGYDVRLSNVTPLHPKLQPSWR